MVWTAEALLTAIGAAAPDECITEERLIEITGLEPRQIEGASLRLRKHEFVERVEPGCLRLTDAGREAIAAGTRVRSGPKGRQPGPRMFKNTLRMRVWSSLRLRKKASVADIVMLAAGDGPREKDMESNISHYLRALARAGYVMKMPRREPGSALTSNGFARWMLLKDTGPLAPVWRPKINAIYDPNTDTETPLCG